MSEDRNEDRSLLSQINGLVAVGLVALLIAFLPTFTGGDVGALALIVGVLLIVGGAIVNAIRERRP
jgi:uncharacterized membrane-anchored protein